MPASLMIIVIISIIALMVIIIKNIIKKNKAKKEKIVEQERQKIYKYNKQVSQLQNEIDVIKNRYNI